MIYNKIENCIGEICKYLLPIKHEHYVGNGTRIAICTLSSIRLLTEISNDTKLMNNLAIVGRLLSENIGIDEIINFCIVNKEIEHLVLCGKDTRGHRAGESLIALFRLWNNKGWPDNQLKKPKASITFILSRCRSIEETHYYP
ncbi:MAG TPA: hypothetical protein VJ772_09415 [Nitrososphaeraceae archaeon]|nr:hypothetical protein [Nitrososphaeraceae archaeon]